MMKLLARYHHRVINPDTGNLEITFAISDYNSKANTEELEKELYSLEIKKPRSKRSLNQNAYLWSLIHELALKMDEDDLDVFSISFTSFVSASFVSSMLKRPFKAYLRA